jgi:hypothetical protein
MQLFLMHLALTAALLGLVWYVQLVQYPLFHLIPAEVFVPYWRRNLWVSTSLAMPLMILESLTALVLTLQNLSNLRPLWWVLLGLIAVAWASTVFLQLPTYIGLLKSKDERLIRRLVNTNWVRTGVWTARTIILVLYWKSLA